MPRILAVDDSATMRRVLELTFAGQDGIEIVAVADGATAVRAAAQHALDLILADASMTGMDGYEVAKAIRDAGGQTPIILLASQHTPFDAEKARAAGIDDHVLKPFDTQSMIDKARDVMSRGRKAGSAAPGPRSSTSSTMQSTPAAPRAPAAPAAAPPAPAVAAAPKPAPRPTASFGPSSPSPVVATPARPGVPASAVVGARPPVAPAAAAAPKKPTLELAEEDDTAAHAPVAAATAAATAAMAGKLGGMGLTPEQVQGILALSREVIERVVWEVVPDLAETIIREEIKRLTS